MYLGDRLEGVYKMRKTKIICTIGPASENVDTLKSMALSGMDIARLNFSHGTHAYHRRLLRHIRKVSKELKRPVGILLDLEGPEIRTGLLTGGMPVELKKGRDFSLFLDERQGDGSGVSVNYKDLFKSIKGGESVFIDDGAIELKVNRVKGGEAICRVVVGGKLGEQKGVHIPGVDLKFPSLTGRDRDDIVFGLSIGVDYIAQSYVRDADNIREIKKVLKNNGAAALSVIAKIESREGVDNIDEIIDVSDGIMVARGDLGVSIPRAEVPLVQKELISKANRAGKPVITATQMLESMTYNSKPTRAEVADVANAVIDGTDCIMLSGETASGLYPVEAVKEMDGIAKTTESALSFGEVKRKRDMLKDEDFTEALCYAARELSVLLKAKMILVSTYSGNTAKVLSRLRPPVSIKTLTPRKDVLKNLMLFRGVNPYLTRYTKDINRLFISCLTEMKDKHILKKGDKVITIGGRNSRFPSQSYFVRIVEV